MAKTKSQRRRTKTARRLSRAPRRVNKRSRSRRGGRCARLRGGAMSKKAIAGTTAGVIGVPILAKYAYDRWNGGSKQLSDPDNRADNTANDKQLIISNFYSILDFTPILEFYSIYLPSQKPIQLFTPVPRVPLEKLYDSIIALPLLLTTNNEYSHAFSKVTNQDEFTQLLLSFYIHSCYFVAYDVYKKCDRTYIHKLLACGWIKSNVDTFEQLIIRYVTKSETRGVLGIPKDTFDIVVRNIENFFNNNETKSLMFDLQTKCMENKTTSLVDT